MGRVGVPVYGVYEDRFVPAAISRYVQGRFVWSNDEISSEQFLAGMAEIAGRLGRPAVLVPTDDRGAILIAEHRAVLAESFVFPAQSASLVRQVASKEGLYRLCRKLGVPCPEAAFPTSRSEVEDFLARAVFPVVMKIVDHWALKMGTGVKSTEIAHSDEQLLGLYEQVERLPGVRFMFQEYIPVEHGEDWIFHGYCNEASLCLVGFTGRKLRSYPIDAGPTTLGQCVVNDSLRRQAEDLFKRINYRGIMDLDYRLDRRDGQYKLLDFNPRIGAQFRLFVDEAGIDVVRALHLDLSGRVVRRSPPRAGRRFMAEHYDLLAGWEYHRHGELTLRGWLRSVQRVEERAWFDSRDFWPFLVMSLRFFLKGLGRAVRKASHSRSGHRRSSNLFHARRQAERPRYIPSWWGHVRSVGRH
jgi:D-aspartate ligase